MEQLRNLFFLYLDSPRRRSAIKGTSDSKGDNYLLYGLERYRKSGYTVRHNLETARRSSPLVHLLSRLINRGIRFYGGIGGDFRSIIACHKVMNQSDVILSTVDPVGIPLALCKATSFIHRPAVYTSMGFPERIQRFRSERAVNSYRRIFSRMDGFVAYGYEEFRLLKAWLQYEGAEDAVHFVPFGVDIDFFSPGQEKREPEVDIVSVGADSYRDFPLLLALARSKPALRIEIITSREHRDRLGALPPNITTVCNIPIEQMKKRMEASVAVVLPIKENSYSGATTTLLQAMALKKPVVVSQVGAIRKGYFLKDGENCLFVEPGNEEELVQKSSALLANRQLQKTLAENGRETVVQNLTQDHYVSRMLSVLTHCHREYFTKVQLRSE